MTLTAEIVYTARYRQLVKEFPLFAIQTRKDADRATKILDVLFVKDKYDDPGEEAYVITLADLLADYEESIEEDMPEPTGLEMLKFIMDQHDLTQAALGKILGIGQSAVSQILSGSKPITAEHARRLGKRFKLDPGAFI